MKPSSRFWMFACAFVAARAFESVACAQWAHRVDLIKLLTSTNNLADHTAVASDGSGGVVVAWRDNRNSTTSGRDVFAQRVNATGVVQWTADGVPLTTVNGTQSLVQLASAPGGGAYAVWVDERVVNDPRIYAQLLNAAGQSQWAVNGIPIGPADIDQVEHAIASDAAGNLFITWREPNTSFRCRVQKLDATGALLWGAGGMEYASGVFAGGSVVNVVPDGTGGAVVGWIEFGDNPRTLRIQRFLANGTAAFSSVAFGTDTTALGNILPLAPDGSGGAIAGWQSGNGANSDLYVQRVSGTGLLPWGSASRVLASQPNAQDNLHLVSDGAGGAFCTWDDARAGDDDVYVQRVDASGAMLWAVNGIPAGTTVLQRFDSKLISDGTGGFIATYRQEQIGIWGQRFNAAGARLWSNEGFQITNNAAVTQSVTTTDGANGLILGVISFTGGNIPAVKRVTGAGAFPQSRLVNISTRAFVGTGASQAIPGFVIAGSGSSTLLIRAVGPTLQQFGVAGTLADPALTLFNSAQQVIATRDNWGEAGDASLVAGTALAVNAFALPSGSKDAAIVSTLGAGLFTAGITGVGNTTGIGLVEIYDASPAGGTSRIVNISSRVFVGIGAELAIPGVVIEGPATMTVLIRAVGPTLDGFGVSGTLANPVLTLFDDVGRTLATSDNWSAGGTTATNALIAAALQVNAFALPNGSADAALLVTLAPGLYTAGVTGTGSTTGVCLVEIYEVP